MHARRPPRLLVVVATLCAGASPAWAGMPSVSLDEVAGARLETISFFVVCFLLCALAVKGIWNGLRADFPKLPRLTYKAALGLLAVWGLLFLVVLTMISGARELLTPGAWEKQEAGATYRLKGSGPDLAERQRNLEDLRTALWAYAEAHEGRLPPDAYAPEIPAKLWRLARSPIRYIYIPGARVDAGPLPVAYEPGVYGAERLVLFADGAIEARSVEQVRAALASAGAQPR